MKFVVNKKGGNKNQAQNADCKIQPTVCGDFHFSILLKQSDYNPNSRQEQHGYSAQSKIRRNQWLFGKHGQDQSSETQLAAVVKEFGEGFRNLLFHAPQFSMTGQACQ